MAQIPAVKNHKGLKALVLGAVIVELGCETPVDRPKPAASWRSWAPQKKWMSASFNPGSGTYREGSLNNHNNQTPGSFFHDLRVILAQSGLGYLFIHIYLLKQQISFSSYKYLVTQKSVKKVRF